MPDPSILLQTGEEWYKDAYEEFRRRLDAAEAVCDVNAIEALMDEIDAVGTQFAEEFPLLAEISNPFYALWQEARAYARACITPAECDRIGCTPEWDWPWIHRIVLNRQCHGAETVMIDLANWILAARGARCPETCIREVEKMLAYLREFWNQYCTGGEVPPPELHAEFDYRVEPKRTRYKAEFWDVSSYPPGDPITRRLWDFGDGTQSRGRFPVHYYYESGVYTVSLTVWTKSGAMDATSKPIRCFGLPEEEEEGE